MSKTYRARGDVSTTLTIANLDSAQFNWTAVVTYYSDQFVTEVTPTAGTVTVSGKIIGAGSDSDFTNGVVDSTDPGNYASASAPLESVTFTPAGITGATHYSVAITSTK